MESRYGLITAAVALAIGFLVAPLVIDVPGAASAVIWFGLMATIVAAVVAGRRRR